MTKYIILLILIGAKSPLANAQKKASGYAYFDTSIVMDSVHMRVDRLGDDLLFSYVMENNDSWGKAIHFIALDSAHYEIIDKIDFRNYMISPITVIRGNYTLGDNWDDEGNFKDLDASFRKFFLVQTLEGSRYKLTQVVPYIGDLLYAPKKPGGL